MLDGISDGLWSSATGGNLFTMEPLRTFEGPRIDFDSAAASPFPRPATEETCERWAVLTSVFEPTEAVNQLAELSEWCVVVVGDKNGEYYQYVFWVQSNVIDLSSHRSEKWTLPSLA